VKPVDGLGGGKDTYLPDDTVYVGGSCISASTNVDIYIVENLTWTNGMSIPPDVSSDGMNTVATDGGGNLGPAIAWPPALTGGEYDIVLDANQNGTYDAGIDAVEDPNHPGFIVCTDNDGDGYYVEGGACGAVDCNDTDDDIYPGATEQCNSVDDDCDTEIDEGCVTYFEDADGDGYGNPAVSVISPAPPPGYVANAADCDDNNAHIHPGAAERCNNLRDDDCDGTVNEGCISGTGGSCFGVGGIAWPVNKIALVAPWVALIMSMIGLMCLVRWRKKRSPGGAR
jgi:hypothetical protein